MNLLTLRHELAREAGRYPTRRSSLLWIVVRALDVVIAYARRWKGDGSDFAQLAHDDHPNEAEITRLVAETALGMGGLPVGIHWEPMAWNDPLDQDDFLDKSDNPADFKYWEPDVEDDLDFDY